MNYEKSKVLLKKINALHDGIDQASGFSALEKDLFLQYLRKLYESVTSPSPESTPKNSFTSNGSSSPGSAPSVVEAKAEPVIQKEEEAKPIAQPVPEAVAVIEKKAPEPEPIDAHILELFEESDTSFDSSRILGGKIKDIGKSMGINEKILTINELFQGQQPLFEKTVTRLNEIEHYEKAKIYIALGIAKDMKWSEDRRKGKAIHFLHLVRRRYSN